MIDCPKLIFVTLCGLFRRSESESASLSCFPFGFRFVLLFLFHNDPFKLRRSRVPLLFTVEVIGNVIICSLCRVTDLSNCV